MGFFRKQQEQLAVRLLAWQYERLNQPRPVDSDLQQQASRLVDDAHRIAKERGKNVLHIMKEMAVDFIKKKS